MKSNNVLKIKLSNQIINVNEKYPCGSRKKMKPNITLSYQIVDSIVELKKMVAILETKKAIAVDIEADSLYHFTEKVCLIQIASEQTVYIIDPLAIKDLSPLIPLFYNCNIQKIFHSADYDIRCLYRDFQIQVTNLFDTQLACRFLGMKETGLDAVLLKQFNIHTDKKYQKKDWSRRPLSQDMLVYAAKDALFLVPLGKALEKALENKGRLSWVYEESQLLSKLRPTSNGAKPLFLKFKGAGRLNPRELAILESILKYRKTVAQRKDLPVFKIIGNSAILKIVKSKPLNLNQLEKTQALSRKQIDRYGRILSKNIQKALEIPENELPTYPRKKAPLVKPTARKRIKVLKSWRERKAKTLGIDPCLVCSKAIIADIAIKNPNNTSQLNQIKELKNWQKNMLGKEIITILRDTDGRKN